MIIRFRIHHGRWAEMVKKNWELKKFGNKKIIHVTGREEGGRIE